MEEEDEQLVPSFREAGALSLPGNFSSSVVLCLTSVEFLKISQHLICTSQPKSHVFVFLPL